MNRELRELSLLMTKSSLSDGVTSRDVVKKILELMTKGIDISSFAGNIIKLLASPDIVVKRVICAFIDRYAERVDDLNLLSTNTLLKDLKDANPLIRGLALKTIFQIPNLFEQDERVLFSSLEDNSSYVRRIAIWCCCRYFKNTLNSTCNSDIIDHLYGMIRDPDPGVVTSCLAALDEILASEGGVVINSNIVHYLLSRISVFHDWGITVVLRYLQKYKPQKEEEIFDVLNCLDEYLQYNNPVVLRNTISVFLSLCHPQFSHLIKEALNCALPHIHSYLMSSNDELVFSMLDFVAELLPYHKEAFFSCHKTFLCRFSDSIIVKTKKLSILPHLVCDSNISEISEELRLHCTDNICSIYESAIKSIVVLTNSYPSHSLVNLKMLTNLMDLQCESLTVQILNAFTSIDLNHNEIIKVNVLTAISKYHKQIEDVSGKCSILCLLGEYGCTLPCSPYILEWMVEEYREEDILVKQALLTACMKLFLHRPAEMQEILGYLLEYCHTDKLMVVSNQANFYYSLLHNISIAKKIVLGNNINI